jgi:hypothetical protein
MGHGLYTCTYYLLCRLKSTYHVKFNLICLENERLDSKYICKEIGEMYLTHERHSYLITLVIKGLET